MFSNLHSAFSSSIFISSIFPSSKLSVMGKCVMAVMAPLSRRYLLYISNLTTCYCQNSILITEEFDGTFRHFLFSFLSNQSGTLDPRSTPFLRALHSDKIHKKKCHVQLQTYNMFTEICYVSSKNYYFID